MAEPCTTETRITTAVDLNVDADGNVDVDQLEKAYRAALAAFKRDKTNKELRRARSAAKKKDGMLPCSINTRMRIPGRSNCCAKIVRNILFGRLRNSSIIATRAGIGTISQAAVEHVRKYKKIVVAIIPRTALPRVMRI